MTDYTLTANDASVAIEITGARNTACAVSLEGLAADAGADRSMKVETARTYLTALDRLLLSDDVPAWSPSLRSRTRLRASPVRHLADPSLAVAALGEAPTLCLPTST